MSAALVELFCIIYLILKTLSALELCFLYWHDCIKAMVFLKQWLIAQLFYILISICCVHMKIWKNTAGNLLVYQLHVHMHICLRWHRYWCFNYLFWKALAPNNSDMNTDYWYKYWYHCWRKCLQNFRPTIFLCLLLTPNSWWQTFWHLRLIGTEPKIAFAPRLDSQHVED